MFRMKVKVAAVVVTAAVAVGSGAGLVIHKVVAAEPARESKAEDLRLGEASLLDVQGLWGGQNVFLQADGSAVVQIVSQGMREKRYELKLDAAKVAEFEKLLARHDFFIIKIKERPGIPDEAHPEIAVRLASGQERKVMKWAGDKHPDFDPLYAWLLAVAESAKAGKPVFEGAFDWKWRPAAKAAGPAKGLTDDEMKKLAEETARKGPFVSLDALVSRNQHLGGETAIPNPLASARLWCVLQGQTPAAPARAFICVGRDGQVAYPFKAEDFGKLLAAEKTSEWKDATFLEAARLYVHLTSVANQDGWKVCQSADEFLAIDFNMPRQGPTFGNRLEVSKQIEAPKVAREKEKEKDKITVTFCAWHLIGGRLGRWTVQFAPEFRAEFKELGRFGGGGYD